MTGIRASRSRRSARRILGIGVWSFSWALAFAAAGLSLVFELPREPLPGLVLSSASAEVRALFPSIGFTVALVYGPVAALLLSRRINLVGVILAVHALGSGLGVFGSQWALLGERVHDLPLWGLLGFASGWSYIPGTFMTGVLPVLVTHARIPRWQWLLVGIGASNAAVATAAALVQQSVPLPLNPLAVHDAGLQSILPSVYLVTSSLAVVLAMTSTGILVARWVMARGKGRTGLAWLTLGHTFISVSYALLVLPAGAPVADYFLRYGLAAPVIGQVIYPAAILVVVLGQGLWGQRVVVSRIILWALLSISGIALSFAIVLIVPEWVPWPEGPPLLVPVLIAVSIEPLRRWFQGRIDELIYGEGADPAALLRRLSERLGELEAGVGGLRELCEAIRSVLRLASVEIAVESRVPGASLTVGAGERVGDPVRVPLPGDTPAVLVVSAPGGQRLDRRSMRVLGDLAGMLEVAVRLVESNRNLDAARDDFFARRAAERRTIQRELHDGLGPALAGIGYGLAAAVNLLEESPACAEELLEELEQDLARRARAVRRLAGEVMPSPLEGTTLIDALRGLAARFEQEPLKVRVIAERTEMLGAVGQGGTSRLGEAVYFIAAEALTNAARHSGASAVQIRLSGDDLEGARRLRLAVEDDGRGIPARVNPGIGLTSMRQRARELGGELHVSPSSEAHRSERLPGTRIIAEFPLRREGET